MLALLSIPAFAQQPPVDQRRLETGGRIYAANCASCHGVDGDAAPGVNLRTGPFTRASTDLQMMEIVLQGIPGTAMTPLRLASGDLVALVAYVRAMKDYRVRPVALGDAAKGRVVFETKGACSSCHRVGRAGSYVAPDLSEIGNSLSAMALEDKLLDPQAAAAPGNRSVRAVKKDGTVVTGRRLNEDTWSVQLMDSAERLVSLWKPDLVEYEILPSPMPSYKDTLTAEERADLLAYLVSLQPAGASGRGRGR